MEAESSFEESLKRLEQIVSELERGESALSSALSKYEQGVGLLARCHSQLEQAERSVSLLTGVDGEGNPELSPFDAEATAERETTPKPRKRAAAPPISSDDSDLPF